MQTHPKNSRMIPFYRYLPAGEKRHRIRPKADPFPSHNYATTFKNCRQLDQPTILS
jgi:hypothetical protein